MPNELQVFEFSGTKVRTVVIDGNHMWCSNDVCFILGYSNPRKAISDHCKTKGVTISDTPTNGGTQMMTYIDEGNLFRLITKSTLPSAEKFESWVFDEVLPSIRKTGSYSVPTSQDDQVLMICDQLKAKIIENRALIADNRAKEETLTAQAPKVALADECLSSDGNYSIGEVAKHICIGQNNLFDSLRRAGILNMKNEPYQRYIDSGYFKLITKTMKCSWSDIPQIYHQTRVTPRGMAWISLNKEKIIGYHVPKKVIRKVKQRNFIFNDNDDVEIDINDLLNS